FHCLDGVRGRRTIDLQPGSGEAVLVNDRGGERLPSQRGAGRRQGCFVRRLRRQDKDYLTKVKDLPRLAREDEMSMMNRIEGSAIDADLLQTRSIKQILRTN